MNRETVFGLSVLGLLVGGIFLVSQIRRGTLLVR